MLPIKFFIALIATTLIATIFIIFSDHLIPHSADPELDPATVAWEDTVETALEDPGEPISARAESVETRVESQLDGPSLLESHCSECHATKVLEQYKKSRSDWELTLEKMEGFGVQLPEDERVTLLVYLAAK
jgi:cytochrome c5